MLTRVMQVCQRDVYILEEPHELKQPLVNSLFRAGPEASVLQAEMSEEEETTIKVVVRVRPFTPTEEAAVQGNSLSTSTPAYGNYRRFGSGVRKIVEVVDEKMLIFDPITKEVHPNGLERQAGPSISLRPMFGQRERKYTFNRVFDGTASQEQVYNDTCRPLLDSVMAGFNATVFAYGATGCGKTHTISGSPNHPGIIFLAMQDLFQRLEQAKQENEVEISMTYLEIYNEKVRDLLSDIPQPNEDLPLRVGDNDTMVVHGLTQHTPKSLDAVIALVTRGNARRTMSPTEANAVSSRSHAVLRVSLSQTRRSGEHENAQLSSILSIIDLAGNERAASSKNRGQQMSEGANINKSLLALAQCITALCAGRKFVPYRDSKLSRLLKFSLGGNCKTVMVVCVSPSSEHFDESRNSLIYAHRTQHIRTRATQNRGDANASVLAYIKRIDELQREQAKLKGELAAAKESGARSHNLDIPAFLHSMAEIISGPIGGLSRSILQLEHCLAHRTGEHDANWADTLQESIAQEKHRLNEALQKAHQVLVQKILDLHLDPDLSPPEVERLASSWLDAIKLSAGSVTAGDMLVLKAAVLGMANELPSTENVAGDSVAKNYFNRVPDTSLDLDSEESPLKKIRLQELLPSSSPLILGQDSGAYPPGSRAEMARKRVRWRQDENSVTPKRYTSAPSFEANPPSSIRRSTRPPLVFETPNKSNQPSKTSL